MSREWNAPHRSRLGRAMDQAEYHAETPTGGISARGRNWYDVTVAFQPGYARRAGDERIAADLVALCRLIFAAGFRQWRAALATESRSSDFTLSDRRRAWQQERDALAVEGRSADGSIVVACVGMGHWSVEVAPGTTQRLDDEELARAVTEAGTRLTERWVTELRALNRRHFFGGSA